MQTTQGSGGTAPVLAPASGTAAPAQAPIALTGSSPTAAWEAARALRSELRNQIDRLASERHTLLNELEDHPVAGPASAGMQARIQSLDLRIAQLDVSLAQADASVAAAAAVPGAVVTPPESPRREGPPEEVFFMVPPLLAAVFLPIAIAHARRIWKRASGQLPVSLPSDLGDRLNRLEAMGETTALEVERIGEGQRFVTRLLTEKGSGLVGDGERVAAQHR